MNFNIYNSIILAGVIQGFIFGAVVLLSKKYKHKSVYFLVAMIVAYSLNNLQYYLVDIGLINYDQFYRDYYFPWAEFTPALLYFYVVSFLFPEDKLPKNSKWLLALFAGHFIVSILYKILMRVEPKSESIGEISTVMMTCGLKVAFLTTVFGSITFIFQNRVIILKAFQNE